MLFPCSTIAGVASCLEKRTQERFQMSHTLMLVLFISLFCGLISLTLTTSLFLKMVF